MQNQLLVAKQHKFELLNSAQKCAKLLKIYTDKLDEQMKCLTEAFENQDEEYFEALVDEDCDLIFDAEKCLLELKQFISCMTKEMEQADSKQTKEASTESDVGRLISYTRRDAAIVECTA